MVGPRAPPTQPHHSDRCAAALMRGQGAALIHPVAEITFAEIPIVRAGARPRPTRRVLIGYFPHVSPLETLLLFGVPTLGVVLLVVLAVVGPRLARAPRHRVGQAWAYAPLWWTANPEGAHLPAVSGRSAVGERGGARGSW